MPPMFAYQFLVLASETCGVDLPGTGWVQHRQGDEVAFTEDGIDWKSKVHCKGGQLEGGQPVRPERAGDYDPARKHDLPVETISPVCSGHDFTLEISTDVTPLMLKRGPTPVPPTPRPTPTPELPGSHL